jgi:tetratricopeptide (TPR) repeat protein
MSLLTMRTTTSILLLSLLAGCSARPKPLAQNQNHPTTRSTDISLLSLDQIEPRPRLSQLQPTTQPTTLPSLPALQLYAKGRALFQDRNHTKAVDSLRSALELDKNSPEINYALAMAYLAAGAGADMAISRLERAAQLQPDNLDTQLQLGRQYLAKSDFKNSIEHLRLALQTSEYPLRPEAAAVVNLLLAKSLQHEGYDIAALDQFTQLLQKLSGRLNVRGYPDLYFIMTRPEWIYMQVGELNEKHGNYDDAFKSYQLAASREPNNFDYQAHLVHALLGLKKEKDARTLAADLVSGHRASPDSIELLRQVYKRVGKESDVIPELQRIMQKRPGDRSIAFALAEILDSAGRSDEARKLLTTTLSDSNWDSLVVSRLFDHYTRRGQTEPAAQVVIDALVHRSDSATELDPLWQKLIRGSLKYRLHLATLQQLDVGPDPSAQASKQFWISRTAELQGRDALARASLERAVALEPPFAPAYRELLSDILSRPDSPDSEKQSISQKLIDRATKSGQKALAAELRGRLALHRKNFPDAIAALDESVQLGANSPAVLYALAAALLNRGEQARAEQILWKIVSDWPTYDDAYLALFQKYLSKGGPAQALKVLQNWLASDPASVSARLLQVNVYMQQDRLDAAESALTRLMRDESDNPLVLSQASQFYAAVHRPGDFQKLLEEEHARHPDNRAAAEWLINLYAQDNRSADALRILDAARAAVAADPDELYYIAHFYDRLERKQMSEQVLQDVLKLDPKNVPASNDLGYLWADEGRNLRDAETMIRHAVSSEPENAAYLDSLGWVLYKRGQFEEAHRHLDQAIKRIPRPDPVVLDHLGDVLYRLNQPQAAVKTWKLSLNRLDDSGPNREDLKTLKLQLRQKIKQQESGQPVNVAPVATQRETQAKSEGTDN